MNNELINRVDAQYVYDHMESLPLIDLRPEQMFKAGHIPGAQLLSLMPVVEAADAYLDDAAVMLATSLEELGIMPHDECIIYCQTGHMASEACVMLKACGYEHLHCYRGSWVDWTQDPTRPVA